MSDTLTIRNCTFAYKCKAQWDDLEETAEEYIRFCEVCQKEVHFCESDAELIANVKLNRCIAILKPYSSMRLLGDVQYT